MKNNPKISGVYAASITPFKADESFDYDAMKRIMDYLAAAKVDGILLAGNTGEFPMIEPNERKELIAEVARINEHGLKLCPCCTANTTKGTLEIIDAANKAGTEYVAITVPYDMPTDFKGTVEHFKKCAEEAEGGVVIYHYPGYFGVQLSPAEIAELAQIDNVVGVKDVVESDEIMSLIHKIDEQKNDTFGVLCAWDRQFVPLIAAGCTGFMGVTPLLAPAQCVEMYNLVMAGKINEAEAIARKLEPIFEAPYSTPLPSGMKYLLNLQGLNVGIPRKPISCVEDNEENRALYQKMIQDAGL